VNGQQGPLASSSKMAPKILIFWVVTIAGYSSKLESINIQASMFFAHNNLS